MCATSALTAEWHSGQIGDSFDHPILCALMNTTGRRAHSPRSFTLRCPRLALPGLSITPHRPQRLWRKRRSAPAGRRPRQGPRQAQSYATQRRRRAQGGVRGCRGRRSRRAPPTDHGRGSGAAAAGDVRPYAAGGVRRRSAAPAAAWSSGVVGLRPPSHPIAGCAHSAPARVSIPGHDGVAAGTEAPHVSKSTTRRSPLASAGQRAPPTSGAAAKRAERDTDDLERRENAEQGNRRDRPPNAKECQ